MRTSKETTRQGLIDAATQVFAEEGFSGATTRQIAVMADVNDSTLFRHFSTKEELLEVVVEDFATKVSDSLKILLEVEHKDIRSVLTHFAEQYNQVLEENELLIRACNGEGKRRPQTTLRIFLAVTQPLKEKIIQYFETLQESGKFRTGVRMTPAIDIFVGMLMQGALRRTVVPLNYNTETYLSHCVDIFLEGIRNKTN